MRALISVAVALLALGLALGLSRDAEADHNTYLPLVPNTPAIQTLLRTGSLTFCTNSAAANYPSFLAQLRESNASDAQRLGINWIEIHGTYQTEVAARGAGCQVWHQGRYDNFCDGCAGNVFYANDPVTINYKLQLGFTFWQTTHSHEKWHIYGLHEAYRDSGGQIGCDPGYQAMVNRLGFATVMSCGTGVWEGQAKDIERVCALYGGQGHRFHACAPQPEWVFDPAIGQFRDRDGNPEFCCDQPWGGYYNRRLDEWSWRPETLWVWSVREPAWKCVEGCP